MKNGIRSVEDLDQRKKVKKEGNVIIFSLEPQRGITFNVYFFSLAKNDLPPTAPRSQDCGGSILVQEYKNADVLKEIHFIATVCFDHAAYISALSKFPSMGTLLFSFLFLLLFLFFFFFFFLSVLP